MSELCTRRRRSPSSITVQINYYIFQTGDKPGKPTSIYDIVQEKTRADKANRGRKNKATKVEEEKTSEVGQKKSLTKQNPPVALTPPPTKGKGAEKETRQKGNKDNNSKKVPPIVAEPVPVKSAEVIQDPAEDPLKSGSSQTTSAEGASHLDQSITRKSSDSSQGQRLSQPSFGSESESR